MRVLHPRSRTPGWADLAATCERKRRLGPYTFRDYAQGSVAATNYVTTPIDFGFPPPPAVPDMLGGSAPEALNAIRAAGLTAIIESRPDSSCEHTNISAR